MAQRLTAVRAGAGVRSDNGLFAHKVFRQDFADRTRFLFFRLRQQARKLRFGRSDIGVGILFEQGALQAAEGFSLAAKALLSCEHQCFSHQVYLMVFFTQGSVFFTVLFQEG